MDMRTDQLVGLDGEELHTLFVRNGGSAAPWVELSQEDRAAWRNVATALRRSHWASIDYIAENTTEAAAAIQRIARSNVEAMKRA